MLAAEGAVDGDCCGGNGTMNIARQRMWDRKRKQRLMSKIQKARLLSRADEICQQPSWSKRFHRVIRLRTEA